MFNPESEGRDFCLMQVEDYDSGLSVMAPLCDFRNDNGRIQFRADSITVHTFC